MTLQVVGAGLPRTATESLRLAVATLLGAPVHHLRDIPGHPYVLGEQWSLALAGGTPDWDAVYDGYAGGFDWPTSLFWRELAAHFPDALVVLSTRDTTETWLDSMEATVLPVARACAPEDWIGGRDLAVMMERLAGTADWDDRAVLGAAYDAWVAGRPGRRRPRPSPRLAGRRRLGAALRGPRRPRPHHGLPLAQPPRGLARTEIARAALRRGATISPL